MARPSEPPDDERANRALADFLRSSDAAEVARTLAHIVDEIAWPIIRRVLARKLGPTRSGQTELEDVASEAKEQLLERLLILRSDALEAQPGAAATQPPIRNLPAYVASLAYSAWARHLSRAYPERAILSNQLRRLVEDRRQLRGFSCWQGPTGERWCGLAAWQRADDPGRPESPAVGERIQRLVSEPAAAAREALGDETDPRSHRLDALLKRLFLWVGAPVEWHDLCGAICQMHEANWKVETLGADEDAAARIPDASPTPHDQMRWKEGLQWLWQQAGQLPPRQRAAYLLHTHTVFEWEAAGIASVSEVAGRLGLSPSHCAELWGRLPLDDLTIAQMLACTRQQVINLRRVARDTLGRALQRWIAEGISSPPAPARSTQVISSVFPTRS